MQNLVIIVPAYNEELCIKPFYDACEPYLKELSNIKSSYLFVDDGSKDNTLSEIKKLRENDERVNYISFSRNCGKEAAMHAGLNACKDKDMVIMMDADLQHPPYLIKDMVEKHEEGYKIVYSRQKSRKKESWFKRTWAKMFYGFFNKHADVPLEQSTKDYMLLDNVVIKAFLDMPDAYRFTKGIFSYVGFKKYCLEFDYIEREQGKTKWNFKKLLKYGFSGLNQFSNFFQVVPVIAGILSFLVMVMSVFFICFHLIMMDTFIILISVSTLFLATDIVLYFLMYVLYSTRKEALRRPTYFIEESSLDE